MKARRNWLGALYLVISLGAAAASHGILKLLALNCPPGEVLFIRGFFMMALLLSASFIFRELGKLQATMTAAVIIRGAFEAAASVLFVVTVVNMPIAELYAIMSFSPLLMTLLGVVLYKHTVGWRRWSAVFVGLIGVIFVIKPDPAAINPWAIIGLAVTVAIALRDLAASRIRGDTSALIASLISAALLTISSLSLGVTESWRLLEMREMLLIVSSAAFLAICIYLSVMAFRIAEVSAVAPFRYSMLLWGALVGYILFAEVPDRWAFFGSALIVGSGLYSLGRNSPRGKQQKLPSATTPA